MNSKEELEKICWTIFKREGCYDDNYKLRLERELKEIEVQMECDYFLDLFKKSVKFPKNDNNIFVAKLLRLVDDFDINKESEHVLGEFPDIDMDFIKVVRDYLKNVWAPIAFGKDNVCAIGNYTTFGIKSSLIDMVRVHDKDRSEILSLTTKIGLKDDDGKNLTFDKALETYKELKEYCDRNPDVADSARRLIYRNRGKGKHAGGLIIANCRIDNLVPLIHSKDDDDNVDIPVSAFVEGLHGQDLGPLGLIKFDMLVINLMAICKCCKIIQDTRGVASICALPGQPNWSDLSYLDDPAALKLANDGKLKGVFQFDSQGIRELAKKGGVTAFEDLVAYNALYRPGPMGMGMHDVYVNRKRGREKYKLHPILEEILGMTYGVMCFQEQVMKILNRVGGIPDMHCEIVRKAISKKKVSAFIKYKEMFLENGQKTLGWDLERVNELWSQIESFAEYGFNKSMTIDTMVPYVGGVKEAISFKPGEKVYCVNQNGNTVETEVIAIHDHGILEGYEITFDDGYSLVCSINHKFLTEEGQMSVQEICRTRSYILCDQKYRSNNVNCKEKWLGSQMWGDCQNAKDAEQSSYSVSEMSKYGLENQTKWNSSHSYFPLRTDIQDLEGKRKALEDLPRMRKSEKGKYSFEDGDFEQREPPSRQEKDFFRNSKENFCTTRSTACQSSTIKEMENRKSREICQMHRSSVEKSEKISYGNMASQSIRLGNGESSLWRTQKTSRFCKRQDLDRSRRFLSLLRTSKQFCKTIPITNCSTAGQNVERRDDCEKRYNVNSCGNVMLQKQFRGDERRLVQDVSGHAKISDTRNLVSRKIVRIVSVGKRQMCDIEVANPTHNFLLPNGVVTSNSHAVAYSYISARCLWLKAHYPIEFFSAILSTINSSNKMKEYKTEAESMGIDLRRVNINKSKERFTIVDGMIYMGFSNIKGIGDEVAERIVAGQPYTSFQDFLIRFGTDARVLEPFIGLNVFGEDQDPAKLFEYYEYFKDQNKKNENRRATFKASCEKYVNCIKDILNKELYSSKEYIESCEAMCGSSIEEQIEFQEEADGYVDSYAQEFLDKHMKLEKDQKEEFLSAVLEDKILGEDADTAWTIVKRYKKSVEGQVKKEADGYLVPFEEFEFRGKLEDKIKDFLKEPKPIIEAKHYGFSWQHLLEFSSDYDGGHTFADFDENEATLIGMIEVHIIEKPKTKVSKKGKGITYYTVLVEDANSRSEMVIFWEDDYNRFQEELNFWEGDSLKGHFLKIRLKKPDEGFSTYGFDAPPKMLRHSHVPKNKEDDNRIIVMSRPKVAVVDTDREIMKMFKSPIIIE